MSMITSENPFAYKYPLSSAEVIGSGLPRTGTGFETWTSHRATEVATNSRNLQKALE